MMKILIFLQGLWPEGKKTMLVMKLSAVLLLFSLHVSAGTYSQEKITLNAKNAALGKVLKSIEKQSGYRFVYSNEVVPATESVYINVRDAALKDVLDQLLRSFALDYRFMEGKFIVITKKNTDEGYQREDDKIKGRILNRETGEPIAGASVVIKGTEKGTVTNSAGMFELTVDNLNVPIIISYVGFGSMELRAADILRSGDISMSPTANTLNDVVVVGYGTQKRSNLTGSIATVKGEAIKDLPARGINDALQGRVAGVFVTGQGSRPGAQGQIIIRGPVNIRGTEPLYVVDGVPFTGTGYNFNIQDIESIEVIKDAGAAAIYGARASGGVILVTTKKGKSGQLNISYNGNYGIRDSYNIPKLLDRDRFIEARIANGDDADQFFGPAANRSQLPNTHWHDELYGQGKEQNHVLSLSGGSERSTFFMSANYNRQDGILMDNYLYRYAFRVNSEHKLANKLKLGQTLYLSTMTENPGRFGGLYYRTSPIVSVYDPTNPLGGWGKTPSYFNAGNPVAFAKSQTRKNNSYDANLNVYSNWEIVKGLNFRPSVAVKYFNSDYYYFNYPYDVGSQVKIVSDFGKGFSKNIDYLANATLSYNRAFGAHNVTALAGYEAQRSSFSNLNGGIDQAFGTLTQNFALVRSIDNRSVSGGAGDYYRVLSQFARVNYNYDDKYIIEGNIRRDGVSTKFGPSNRYGLFPSVGATWKIIKEQFAENLKVFSDLRFRASYGLLGNSDIPDYLFFRDYTSGFVADVGGGRSNSIALTTKIANENIKWEDVTTTNFAIEGALLKNRLAFTLEWYNRQTKKMLYDIPIPGSAGQGTSIPFNIGEMSNKGIEVLLTYKDKIGDLGYELGVNGSFNKNKLISLDPEVNSAFFDGGTTVVYSYATASKSEPGQPLGQFFGWKSTGIYQSDAQAAQGAKVQGDKLYTPKAGDLIYQDLNKDGIINNDDRMYIGNPWPKLVYGFTAGANWKGFDLNLFLQGVAGVDIYNAHQSLDHVFYGDYNTTAGIFNTSFFNGNGLTNVPRTFYNKTDPNFGGTDPNGNWTKISSYHVQKGDYLRLRNLQLGYTLTPQNFRSMPFASARVFVMADNLFTVTNYTGLDPDLGGFVRSRGVDLAEFRYPPSRLVSLGLTVNFK